MECNDRSYDIIFRNDIHTSHPGYHHMKSTNNLDGGFSLTQDIDYNYLDQTLGGAFGVKSINPYPHLIITGDKLKQQNVDIYEKIMDHEVVTINNEESCKEPFNIRNLNDSGLLQAGYARNIDLDSELKRINHLTDKCYYDNYKYHPLEAEKGNGLYCHRKVLVNNYSAVGQQDCMHRGEYKSAIEPGYLQINENTRNMHLDNTVSYGCHTRPEQPNEKYDKMCNMIMEHPNKCSSFKEFNKVDNASSIPYSAKTLINYKYGTLEGNSPHHYKFNGDIHKQHKKLTQDYPVQRIFNNFTKRSTLPNFHNTFDINPKYIC